MRSACMLALLVVYSHPVSGSGGEGSIRRICPDGGVSSKLLRATGPWDIKYETVRNLFIQDDPRANPAFIGAAPARFGLLDKSPNRWRKFIDRMERLNNETSERVVYKLFILGRHGEGWHNVGEAYYGTKSWDNYWSKLNGNGTITWGPDAELTPYGESQARRVNALWKTEHPAGSPTGSFFHPTNDPVDDVATGAPLPQKLYSSPLSRAVQTTEIVYGDVVMQGGRVKPMIVENLREVIGVHTCDKRRSRSYLSNAFPLFGIESGFSEEDDLWRPDYRETDEEVTMRVKSVLDRILEDFWNSNSNYIAITVHGGIIRAILRIFNHRSYAVTTGGVVPVLVKASRTRRPASV